VVAAAASHPRGVRAQGCVWLKPLPQVSFITLLTQSLWFQYDAGLTVLLP
jgi:hypothetical protein